MAELLPCPRCERLEQALHEIRNLPPSSYASIKAWGMAMQFRADNALRARSGEHQPPTEDME